MKFHDELNPKLWENEELKQEVKDKLKEIAEAFIAFMEINEDAVQDMVITGSCASYNYTKYSDVDLHLVIDFEKVHEDCPIVQGFLLAKKSQFNDKHDISIYGIPVEVYTENVGEGTIHNGLYSLNTGWIDFPKKIEPTDNDAAVEAKYKELKDVADECEDSEQADELITKIRTMRKSGLEAGGEFSTENLAFKKLRDEGVIGKLMDIKKKEIDKQLSLESYNEAEKKNIILEAKYEQITLSKEYPYDETFLLKDNNEYKIAICNYWNDTKRYLKSQSSPYLAIDNLVKSLKSSSGAVQDAISFGKFNDNEFSQYFKTKLMELQDTLSSFQKWELISIGSSTMGGEYWQLDKTDKGFNVFRWVDEYKECYSRNQKSAEEALDKAIVKCGRLDGKYNTLSDIVENNSISEFYDNEYSKYFYTKAVELYNKMYPEHPMKNESIKEEISDMTKQDIDNVMEVLKNDKKYFYDNHISTHVLYLSAIKKRIPELMGLTDNEALEILDKLGYPVSYNPFGLKMNFVADEKMSYEEFNKFVDNISIMVNEDINSFMDKVDSVTSDIHDMIKTVKNESKNEEFYTKLEEVLSEAEGEKFFYIVGDGSYDTSYRDQWGDWNDDYAEVNDGFESEDFTDLTELINELSNSDYITMNDTEKMPKGCEPYELDDYYAENKDEIIPEDRGTYEVLFSWFTRNLEELGRDDEESRPQDSNCQIVCRLIEICKRK